MTQSRSKKKKRLKVYVQIGKSPFNLLYFSLLHHDFVLFLYAWNVRNTDRPIRGGVNLSVDETVPRFNSEGKGSRKEEKPDEGTALSTSSK